MNKHEPTPVIRRSAPGIDRTKYPGEKSVIDTRIRKIINLYNTVVQGLVVDITHNGVDSLTSKDRVDIARQIGTSLYDITPIWSGYYSVDIFDAIKLRNEEKAALKAACKKCPKQSVITWTSEHFYPRQVAGDRVVEYVCTHGNIKFDTFVDMVHDFITVHRVTPEENTKLRPFQRIDTFTRWEDSYQAVGIVLVHNKTGDTYNYR
jgi:hypothetical protein